MKGGQVHLNVTMTPMIKKIIILNVIIWFVGVVIIQGKFMAAPYLYHWFGLVPGKVFYDFWLWQPFTYAFLHAASPFHILFNMLSLWFLGAELEQKWGSKNFLKFYLATAISAGALYVVALMVFYFISGNGASLGVPVVGASGAVFAVLLAYGLLFGDRMIYFFMIFPMKAKYFVLILGAVEFVTLLEAGVAGQVSNLAHLLGILTGYLYLLFWTRSKQGKVRRKTKKHGRRLKLVVDNERDDDDGSPRYWN